VKKWGLFAGAIFYLFVSDFAQVWLIAAESATTPPGRYLVKIAETPGAVVPMDVLLSLVAEEIHAEGDGAKVVRKFKQSSLLLVEGTPEQVEELLTRQPFVEYFEKEIYWKVDYAGSTSELPSSQNEAPWLKDVLGLDAAVVDPEIDAGSASPVLVAVVDTGLNVNHPFFGKALSRNAREATAGPGVDSDGNGYKNDVVGANVYTKDGNVAETSTDHGTHVAGLVKIIRDQAIVQNPEARAVQLLPVKFINSSGMGSTSAAIAALEYAVSRGAKVINASWGAKGTAAFSQALYDTLLRAYSNNIFIAVAAGNADGGVQNNNDVIPTFPANYDIPGLMSIASVTPAYRSSGIFFGLTLSDFSNYGPQSVDIAAPGSFLDASGDASGVLSVNANATGWGDAYFKKRGTSMATPVLAGVAAVVRAINPGLTAYEVKELLLRTAKRDGALASIKSSAVVDAQAAFNEARIAQSQGLLPGANGVTRGSSGDEGSRITRKAFGGCGLVSAIGNHDDAEGPFGGNSLGLFAELALGMAAVRKWRTSRKSVV